MIETKLIQGSLFTGIGGFDLGFELEGIETTWQAEQDKNCLQLLENKFSEARRYTDVREIGRNTETVDIITGGFPCQDVSVAGHRAGLAGERSGLWFEFHRVIAEHLPGWVVIENVPGLLSSNEGRDFAVILRGLVECGYGVAWRILDAQYFGVAQRRRRVFIVGSLGNGRAAKVLFESEGVPGDTAPGKEAGEGTTGTIAGSLRSGGDGGVPSSRGENIVPSIVSNGDAHSGFRDEHGLIAYALNSRNNRLDGESQTMIVEQNNVASTPDMISLRSNPAQPVIAINLMVAEGRPSDKGRMGSGIGKPGEPANTISSSHSHGVFFNTGVRRLTPTECERLQGFPDGWTEGFSDSVRYRMLGNAVAVPVTRWLAKRIKEQR